MHSLKAFINENHSQKIAPWSTAIFPYFTAFTERKLSLGLTGCHIKRDVSFNGSFIWPEYFPVQLQGVGGH